MRWEVNSELLVVQGSIERARDIIQNDKVSVSLAEDTRASTTYSFSHETYGAVGKIKISVLPQNKTEVYGYPPQGPENRWLVEYLRRNIPWKQLGDQLFKLINVYTWQIQEGVFDLNSHDLFKIAFEDKKIDWGWGKFGLEDLEVQKQAEAEFEKWRRVVHGQQIEQFKQITDVILMQVRADRLSLVVFDRNNIKGKFLKFATSKVDKKESKKAKDKTKEPWEYSRPHKKERDKIIWNMRRDNSTWNAIHFELNKKPETQAAISTIKDNYNRMKTLKKKIG